MSKNEELGRTLISKNDNHEKKVYSHDLLAGKTKITIRHANEDYYLRVTKANKLILTK